MSEQPKPTGSLPPPSGTKLTWDEVVAEEPKPTGEWTSLTLSRLIKQKGYKGAADAHNAALAAKDEENYEACLHYEEQLAAERDCSKRFEAQVDDCQQQLAAAQQPLVNILEQVLSETVDAPTYPDGPCLDASTRTEIKELLAQVKKGKV